MDESQTDYDMKESAFTQTMDEAVEELGKQTPNLDLINAFIAMLERWQGRFITASDNLIEAKQKNNAELEELVQLEKKQALYFGRSEFILKKLHKVAKAADKEDDEESTASKGKLHRYPKLELPKFGGEARDWLHFWSAFQTIHEDTVPDTLKFQYLIKCMEKGSVAAEIVSSYPVTAANYPQVIKSLKERFGREDMLVEVYIRDLLSLILENANCKSTANFSSLYVRLSSQLRALGSLGVTTDKCAAILYPMVESALPEEVFVAWERHRHSSPDAAQSGEVHLEKLMEFLKFEVEGSERYKLARQPFSTSTAKGEKVGNKNKPPVTAANLVATEGKTNTNGCAFCDGKHASEKCCKAVSMSLEERRKLVQEKRRCFACLKGGHSAKKCKEAIRCVSCGRKHYAIMCPEIIAKSGKQEHTMDEQTKKQENSSVDLCNQLRSQDVLLQTISLRIVGEKKSKVVRALFDSGSQSSYILNKTAKEVGLKKTGEKEVVHILFGGKKSEVQKHNCYRMYLSDISSSFSCNFEVQDSSAICGSIQHVPQGDWLKELKQRGIKINEEEPGTSLEIELLIGSDVYAKLLTGRKIELSAGPVALQTKFGWTLSGKLRQVPEKPADSTETVFSFHVRDASIQDLWNLDVLGIKDPVREKTDHELATAALEHFKQTVRRKDDGRYIVKLPFIEGHPPLPSYRYISEKKLSSTTERLNKQGVLQAYHEVFKGWEEEGIVEKMSTTVGHYLSHHGVLKPESVTTPVRPVFNASFKTKGNPSLNDCVVVGPNTLEEIPSIVTRFRLGPVGVTSDIRKAFLQIELAEEDRDFVRFLWYEDSNFNQIQDFRHTRVVFGVSSSPFLLAATLNHHLDSCDDEFKVTADILKNSFYVDNCVASLSSIGKAVEFKEQATLLLASAKMDLRCWEIGPSLEDRQVPVLGLSWNLKNDILNCDLRSSMMKLVDGATTRRKILSVAHSIFDPIGMTCAFTIIPKMLLQTTYKVKAGWDTPLDVEVDKKFKLWCEQLEAVTNMKIPRCIAKNQDKSMWSLHVFTDASSAAFASCVFLRSGMPGQIEVQLVMARSRVAPLKDTTIPRLELIGCLCGARLGEKVKTMMEMPSISITYWTDSTTALAWMKNEKCWSVFVGNRVKEIRQLCDIDNWRHVPGKLNPADIPSRGTSVKSLVECSWWEGPSWLKLDEENWPQSPLIFNQEEVQKEERRIVISHVNTEHRDLLLKFNQVSSYNKVIRFVAYFRRFIQWSSARKEDVNKGPFSLEELRSAEFKVVKLIQKAHFHGLKDTKLKNLHVYLDNEGLIRLKTRLFPGEGEEYSCPIVLPSKEAMVHKLIWMEHIKLCHAGVQILQANLREKFWILQSRRTIRGVIWSCVKCRRFRAQPIQVPEGPLPKDRITVGPAFHVTGVDMAGPLYTKGNKKVWIAIFTCATYRAIHLELCSSLTSEIFIAALRRFVARRGRPSVIYSDNGLNFVGCSNLLKKVDWEKIVDAANIQEITWKFNPPTASWWGGFWERMIGIVKQLLRSVLGSSRVNNEELQTLLCEVESVVNNRPLTYVSEDGNELSPLTPMKMINNCGTSILVDVDAVERDLLVAKYKNMQCCRDELRNRFKKEYLAMLVSNGKSKKSRDVQVGDVVIVGNDIQKRIHWPMGVIEEVIPGRDGHVRVVKVKTANGTFIRPVQRLFPLEINNEEDKIPFKTSKE